MVLSWKRQTQTALSRPPSGAYCKISIHGDRVGGGALQKLEHVIRRLYILDDAIVLTAPGILGLHVPGRRSSLWDSGGQESGESVTELTWSWQTVISVHVCTRRGSPLARQTCTQADTPLGPLPEIYLADVKTNHRDAGSS